MPRFATRSKVRPGVAALRPGVAALRPGVAALLLLLLLLLGATAPAPVSRLMGQIPLTRTYFEQDSTGWTPLDRGMLGRGRSGPELDFSSERAVVKVVPVLDLAYGKTMSPPWNADATPGTVGWDFWDNTRGARFEGLVDDRWIFGGELMERQVVAMPFWQEGLEGSRSLPGWGRVKWREVRDSAGVDTGERRLDVGRARGWVGWMERRDGAGWGVDAGIDGLSRHLGMNGYLGCVQAAPAPYVRVVWGSKRAGMPWRWEGVASRTTGLGRQVLGETTEPLYVPQGTYGAHVQWRPGGGVVVHGGLGHLRTFRTLYDRTVLHRTWGGGEVQWHRGAWRLHVQGAVNVDRLLHGLRPAWRPATGTPLAPDGTPSGEAVAGLLGGGAGFTWTHRGFDVRWEWNVQPRNATREGPDWLAMSHAGLPLGPFAGDGHQSFRAYAAAPLLSRTRLPLQLSLAHLRYLPAPSGPSPSPPVLPIPGPGIPLTGHLTELTLAALPSPPAPKTPNSNSQPQTPNSQLSTPNSQLQTQTPNSQLQTPNSNSNSKLKTPNSQLPWLSPSLTLWVMGARPSAPGDPSPPSSPLPVTLGWLFSLKVYVPSP